MDYRKMRNITAELLEIINDNLKDQTGRIKNSCNLIGSINAEKFKRNLADCITDTMQVYKELEAVIFNR